MRATTQNLVADSAKSIKKTMGQPKPKSLYSKLSKSAEEFRKTQESKLKESIGALGKSIKGAPKEFGQDTKRIAKSFDFRESKAVRVLSQLMGKPWNKTRWYVKMIILFMIVCIFPAIPLFYIMGIMMKTLNYLFFHTRRL